MCVLLVCLCEPDPVHLALAWISSATLSLSAHFTFPFDFLTGQVALPLGIISLCCVFVQGSTMAQNGLGIHQVQDQMKMIL
jgi:uncharacterized integral membrane protein